MTAEQMKNRNEAAKHMAYLCKKYYPIVIDKIREAERKCFRCTI